MNPQRKHQISEFVDDFLRNAVASNGSIPARTDENRVRVALSNVSIKFRCKSCVELGHSAHYIRVVSVVKLVLHHLRLGFGLGRFNQVTHPLPKNSSGVLCTWQKLL